MRLAATVAIAFFCLKTIGQNPAANPVFDQQAARFYAVEGIARVNLIDSIFPAASANDPKKTIGLLEEALQIVEKSALETDEKLMRSSKLTLKIGDCWKTQFKMPEAFAAYERAMAIGSRRDSLSGKTNPDRAWAMVSLGKLTASSLNSTTSFDKGFEYFMKAEPIFRDCKDTAGLIFNLDMMSGVAFDHHHADLALRHGRTGLALAKIKKPALVPQFLRRIAQSFLLTEQPDSTIFYLDQIGTAFDAPEKMVRKANIHFLYGEAFFNKKDWPRAIAACHDFIDLGKKTNIPVGMYSPMYYLLADACYQSGRYKEAFEHMEKFKFLEDSIHTITNDARVSELRETFEAGQREQEIALLKAKNEVQKLWRWLLGALLVLVSLGGWLFFRWLLKKRKAREAVLIAENSVLQARFDRLLNLHLDKKLELTGNPDDDFMPHLFAILEKNMANENFNIEALPHEMGISRAQFFKKTKDLTGKSPAELLRELRMQKAKRLLISNHTTVAEVAYATGFASPDSFGRAFKSFFGENPSVVKRSNA